MLLNSIQSVLSLLIMIGIGYIITGRAWFGRAGMEVCSKFCVKIAIPCYMFCNVIATCKTREELVQIFSRLPIPVFIILICFGLGLLLSRLCKVGEGRRGIFVNVITFSNTVIVGFPVIIALMGEEALSDAMIYYMANTVLFWTLGTWLLRKDGQRQERQDTRRERMFHSLKNICSPPLMGFLLGVAVILLRIELPQFLFDSLNYIKQSTTALSMIFIGSVIRNTGIKNLTFTKEMAVMLAGRFLLAPALMFAVCVILPIDNQLKLVFCIMTIMPAMTQLGIMAKESNSDYTFASVIITVSTLVGLAAIPFYMEVFARVFSIN